ncbi:MAG TPA: VPDSG-CTERM sorting domain-containing protein [Dongiaceae bacterium]|nr:VPDSG-CTERM sorting domain-containing protein [Dongiaceae bacterium]
MKNTLFLNRPLLKTALFSTLALTCLAPLPQLKAQSAGPLVFAEVNDKTLTATLGVGGPSYGTVTGGGAGDAWSWFPPATASIPSVGNGVQWAEPGNPSSVNLVQLTVVAIGPGPTPPPLEIFLSIQSDVPPAALANNPAFPNGYDDPAVFIIDPSVPGGQVSGMEFIDKGDAVPDGGSTVMLLGTALSGIAFLRRKPTA